MKVFSLQFDQQQRHAFDDDLPIEFYANDTRINVYKIRLNQNPPTISQNLSTICILYLSSLYHKLLNYKACLEYSR